MKIFLGEKGLDKSWQQPFEKNKKCQHCGENARIAFVVYEPVDTPKDNFVCDLHEQGKENKLWLHDLCACAVYLCEKCLEVTAEINQA